MPVFCVFTSHIGICCILTVISSDRAPSSGDMYLTQQQGVVWHYLKAGRLCRLPIPSLSLSEYRQWQDCWFSWKQLSNCSLWEGRCGGDLSKGQQCSPTSTTMAVTACPLPSDVTVLMGESGWKRDFHIDIKLFVTTLLLFKFLPYLPLSYYWGILSLYMLVSGVCRMGINS